MRHAIVCTCRACALARFDRLMEDMPDSEGKLAVAVAAIQLGGEPLDVGVVALPYPEVLAVVERMDARLEELRTLCSEALEDPHHGPADDLVAALERDLRVLRGSWDRTDD